MFSKIKRNKMICVLFRKAKAKCDIRKQKANSK